MVECINSYPSRFVFSLMVVMIIKYILSLSLLFSFAGFFVAGCTQTHVSSSDERFGISLENATRLESVTTYGEGQALEISLSPNGRWMAVRSTLGFHLYDTQTWEALELNSPRQLIGQMSWSPTGNLLALSIPATNEIEVWRLPEAELVHRIVIPDGYSTLLGLSFTSSGDRLISISFQAINVWRVNDGGLIQSFESPEGASFKNTSISEDGTLLTAVLVGNAVNGIMAWQLEDQGLVEEYSVSEGNRFDAGQFSPTGGQYAALAGEARKLFIWQSLTDPDAVEIQSSSYIVNFAWVARTTGHMLATGNINGEVMLWESTTGKLLTTLYPPVQESVKLLQADVMGNRLVVVYENGSIGSWSLPDGSLEWIVEPVAGEVPTQVAIHTDSTRLFGLLPNGRVRIWDMQDGREIEVLEKFMIGKVLDLAFSPGGEWLAAGLENGLASLWRSDAGENSRILLDQGIRVDSVAFSPDTTRLATGVGGYISALSYDDTVQIWDWANASMLQRLAGGQEEVLGCSVFRNRVAFSPDGLLLASTSHDFSVTVWDVNEQRLWKTLRGHTQPVLDMAMSADGTLLVSASLDGSIRLWRTQEGTEYRVIEGDKFGMQAVAISPDGRLVAGSSIVGVISIWDTASGRLLRTLDGNMNNSGMLAFSPDGSLIAAGVGEDLHLWSSQSGELIATLPGKGGSVISVVFSNDGELLAYGSETGLIHLWKAS